jgi:hypothetical protein
MRFQLFCIQACVTLAVLAGLLVLPSFVLAQDQNQNQLITNQAGVYIDAQGVFRTRASLDPTGQLTRERIAAAKAALSPDERTFSKSRKISLNRLEAAILARQGVPTEEMKALAGLQRVKNVFYYPDTKDIVIAGPAEGWITAPSGRVVGMTTGRPVIQLQDLAAALRAFPPGGKPTPLIGCSIDPTPEGLAAMQRYLRSVGGTIVPAQTPYIVENLRNNLGLQTVRIDGISPRTRIAQVLVEADYRMKLIGIGLEAPPVKMASYVDRASPGDISRNALARWYFVPDYECVRVSNDYLAMELIGDGVKLVGENELVSASGQRRAAGGASRASQAFTIGFTKKYPLLAERSVVYADLRNLIDLLVATAFIQHQDYYGQAGWSMPFLGSEKSFAIETYAIPKTVETAVNAVWKGGTLMTPVGGGVNIQAARALRPENLLEDKDGKVSELRQKTPIHLAPGQWWWD